MYNQKELEMYYIGTCSLLARLSSQIKNSEDLLCIELALGDCCRLLDKRFEYRSIQPHGFSLELVRAKEIK